MAARNDWNIYNKVFIDRLRKDFACNDGKHGLQNLSDKLGEEAAQKTFGTRSSETTGPIPTIRWLKKELSNLKTKVSAKNTSFNGTLQSLFIHNQLTGLTPNDVLYDQPMSTLVYLTCEDILKIYDQMVYMVKHDSNHILCCEFGNTGYDLPVYVDLFSMSIVILHLEAREYYYKNIPGAKVKMEFSLFQYQPSDTKSKDTITFVSTFSIFLGLKGKNPPYIEISSNLTDTKNDYNRELLSLMYESLIRHIQKSSPNVKNMVSSFYTDCNYKMGLESDLTSRLFSWYSLPNTEAFTPARNTPTLDSCTSCAVNAQAEKVQPMHNHRTRRTLDEER